MRCRLGRFFQKEWDRLKRAGSDLVVLSDGFFDSQRVSDEGIKQLKSVLTVAGRRIVYHDIH
jgi:endonuclease IV